jgi:hypothetical protein
VRAALDQDGALISYAFESKGFSHVDLDTNESDPAYSLADQIIGMPLKPLRGFAVPAEFYGLCKQAADLGDNGPPCSTVPSPRASGVCATRSQI